jgi:hypothetical protein
MIWPAALLARFYPHLFQHRHHWVDNAWNPYMVVSEQRCACGAYQHRQLDADRRWDDPEPWLPGPHPICARLRAEGKTHTDGYYDR